MSKRGYNQGYGIRVRCCIVQGLVPSLMVTIPKKWREDGVNDMKPILIFNSVSEEARTEENWFSEEELDHRCIHFGAKNAWNNGALTRKNLGGACEND